MRFNLMIGALSMACLALTTEASVVRGDGGEIRFSGRRANRLITVFTAPTPLRAGPADISLLVQDAESGRPLLDDSITVEVYQVDRPQSGTSVPATSQAATNKLLRAAWFQLSEQGPWHVVVTVNDLVASPPIEFDMDVAAPPPPWLELSVWIGWPLAAIGLFAIHQAAIHRRGRFRLPAVGVQSPRRQPLRGP